MARACLGWSRADLGAASGVGLPAIVGFEEDQTLSPDSAKAIRETLEREGVGFIESGVYRGCILFPGEGRH